MWALSFSGGPILYPLHVFQSHSFLFHTQVTNTHLSEGMNGHSLYTSFFQVATEVGLFPTEWKNNSISAEMLVLAKDPVCISFLVSVRS